MHLTSLRVLFSARATDRIADKFVVTPLTA
jgi:hypothetical protein